MTNLPSKPAPCVGVAPRQLYSIYSAGRLKLTAAVHAGTCSHWQLGHTHLFFISTFYLFIIMKTFLIHYNISHITTKVHLFFFLNCIKL